VNGSREPSLCRLYACCSTRLDRKRTVKRLQTATDRAPNASELASVTSWSHWGRSWPKAAVRRYKDDTIPSLWTSTE
jgi:hypothetical protein